MLGNRGISLIEILIYTGILTLMVTTIGSTILALSRVYASITAEQRIEEAALIGLDRILSETKKAISVTTGASNFNTTLGKLAIQAVDKNDDAMSVEFYVATGTLRMKENGVDVGPLTSTSTAITQLVFQHITTSQSEAVKVEMLVESGTSTNHRSKTFYGTAVLRGSYTSQ